MRRLAALVDFETARTFDGFESEDGLIAIWARSSSALFVAAWCMHCGPMSDLQTLTAASLGTPSQISSKKNTASCVMTRKS